MSEDEQHPTPKKPDSLLNDSSNSTFTNYPRDPRLPTLIEKQKLFSSQRPFTHPFVDDVLKISDEEEFLDRLRQFKKEQHQSIIATYESEPIKNREVILYELSHVAEIIVHAAIRKSYQAVAQRHGIPSYLSSYKQLQESHLAIIAMGKFGEHSINYQSDLDLIFVYSNRGETQGKTPIDNTEFFIKVAQKFINTLAINTSQGRCYQIDTELRPSGNTGALVTSYDYFIDHQMNRSQNWERQALLRARAISDHSDFQQLLQNQIHKLCFERDLPFDFNSSMNAIRDRILNEKVRETDDRINLKLGKGSLMDIEFIAHAIQLRHARFHPDLAQNSIFNLFRAIGKHNIISTAQLETLTDAFLLFRTLESLLQLKKLRSETTLDCTSEEFAEFSKRLGYSTAADLKGRIITLRDAIRSIYDVVCKG